MRTNPNTAIIEISPGPGGLEAKLWAHDLLRMYQRYAVKKGWKAELIDDLTIRVTGSNAYQILKGETGTHRVQRIPQTEKRGRIHTSTAVVVVLPQAVAESGEIRDEDLKWEFFRSGGHGGQNVNKVSTAVRLYHQPTGIVVEAQRERTQQKNREIALEILASKLYRMEQEKKQGFVGDIRQSAGTGARSEKIRTYNFPQNRVTDHRKNIKIRRLEELLNGNLDLILNK